MFAVRPLSVCARAIRRRGPTTPKREEWPWSLLLVRISAQTDVTEPQVCRPHGNAGFDRYQFVAGTFFYSHSLVVEGQPYLIHQLSPVAVVDKQRPGCPWALCPTRRGRLNCKRLPGPRLLGWSRLQNNTDGRCLGVTGVKAKSIFPADAYRAI